MKIVSKMTMCVFLQVKMIYNMEIIEKYDDERSNFFSQIFHNQIRRGQRKLSNPLVLLVRPARFELATSRFVVWRSIQLSHGRKT